MAMIKHEKIKLPKIVSLHTFRNVMDNGKVKGTSLKGLAVI